MTDSNQTEGRTALFIPALDGLYETGRKLAYPLLRIVAGGFMIPHGWGKIFGGTAGTAQFFAKIGLEPAHLLAIVAGSQEVLGGLCIALGLLTRFWAAGAVILLGVAAASVHWSNGFSIMNGGYEYAVFWMVAMIFILFQGGGRFSVDRLIGREL